MSLKILGSKKRKFLRFMREAVRRRLTVESSELLTPLPYLSSESWEFLSPAFLNGDPEPPQLRSPVQLKKRSAGSSSGSSGRATFDLSTGVAPICAAHMR